MLGDFSVKTHKQVGKYVFSWKSIKKKRNVVCDRYSKSYVSHYVLKDFKIQTLIKQLMAKYPFFKKLPQISHIHKNHNL